MPSNISSSSSSGNNASLAKTWIRGFDSLIGGGFPRSSFIILAGHPGTGKSTFAIQFLLNGAAMAKETGIYASFLEREEIFIRNMSKSYGFDFKKPLEEGTLQFLEFTPMAPDVVSDTFNMIVKRVIETGAKRLVIDSLNALFVETSPAEQRRILEIVLNRIIKDQGCTVIAILEQSIGKTEIGFGIEEFVADGLIVFESYIEGLEIKRRAIVRKLRGMQHSSRYQSILLNPNEGISFLQLAE
ncbi:ATPase domain-containing protein [Nitrososphaera sp.]|uniref:RAD55 family ATPase n=1 Tax=Nitrososphaera sp. TaxID=1971748 RepID=UPI00307EEF75